MKIEQQLIDKGGDHFKNYLKEDSEIKETMMDLIIPEVPKKKKEEKPIEFDIQNSIIQMRSLIKSSKTLTSSLMTLKSVNTVLKYGFKISTGSKEL